MALDDEDNCRRAERGPRTSRVRATHRDAGASGRCAGRARCRTRRGVPPARRAVAPRRDSGRPAGLPESSSSSREARQRRLAALRLVALRFVALRLAGAFLAALRLVALRLAGALRFAALRFAGALRLAALRLAGALRFAGDLRAALRLAGALRFAALRVLFFAGGTVTTFLGMFLGRRTPGGLGLPGSSAHGGLEAGACRELHALGCRDLDGLTGLRVAPGAGLALGSLERTEPWKLHIVASCDCRLDALHHLVEHVVDILLRLTRCFRDVLDEFG